MYSLHRHTIRLASGHRGGRAGITTRTIDATETTGKGFAFPLFDHRFPLTAFFAMPLKKIPSGKSISTLPSFPIYHLETHLEK